MRKLKMVWIVRDGSIYTRDAVKVKTGVGAYVTMQLAVAFNVGDCAEHIVHLHNESL
jgi:hypothetical protein